MKQLARIVRIIDQISGLCGNLSSVLIFILMLVMVYEVFMRYLFTAPTIWVMELSGYLMMVFVALGGSYVLREGGHINVDIIYGKFSKRGRAIIDIATFGLFCLFLYYFFILSANQAITSVEYLHRSGTIWNPPIWPLKIIVAVGVGLVLLQGLAKFIRDLVFVVSGVPLVEENLSEGDA